MSGRLVSEQDFVSNQLLPQLKEAREATGVREIVDFHVIEQVDGFADLTIERAGKRLLVVEAKFKKKAGKIERDIEPRDPEVIDQAVGYAVRGGFPYYATCNARRIILFQLRPGVKAYESEILSLDYEKSPEWAQVLLKTILGVIPAKLKPVDDTLVDTLREAFNDLFPEFLTSLRDRLRESKFKKRYVDWLESQGIEFSDDNNRLIAEQTTYLQLNKLLFYQVLRIIYPKLSALQIEEDQDVPKTLAGFFEEIKKIDYEPIYESDVISEVSFTIRAGERVRTLIDTLNQFDFSRFESDFLGTVYEKLIPSVERKRLGQFYTPPGIVDLIVRLSISDSKAKVLDPGCGSGSFLVRAYSQLRELNGIPRFVQGGLGENFHRQLLESIYGIDINQFPAHLSVINLAIQNARARINKVNVVVKDFFDTRPGQATLSGFGGMTVEGKPTKVVLPTSFDVVVANPPYIRQELLGDKEKAKIKRLVEDEFKDKLFLGEFRETRYGKKPQNAVVLERTSDIFVYFFIHAIAFLRPNGVLGFIASNKWLEVGYGVPFQQFLLENVKVLYVIEFDRAMFPDAEVNTAITIFEKETRKADREKNDVKFVRVKKRLDMNLLLKSIREAQTSFEDDTIRINVVRQESLVPGKWNIYLRAPLVYAKIAENSNVKKLKELADVFFGIKTGYNPFFLLSEDEAKERQIESRYRMPCVYSPKDVRGLVIDKPVGSFLFSSHDSPAKLRGTKALEYVRYGEKLKVDVERGSERKPRLIPELESVSGHKPLWYSLPEFDAPQILVPKLADSRLIAIWNKAGVQASDLFYYVVMKNKESAKILLGYLNSSLGALLGELYGRSYGGGVLDIKVYEAKQLPVMDPAKITEDARSRISESFDHLAELVALRVKAEEKFERARAKARGNVGLLEKEAKKDLVDAEDAERKGRKELDGEVYEVLGLTEREQRQIENAVQELRELRRLRTMT